MMPPSGSNNGDSSSRDAALKKFEELMESKEDKPTVEAEVETLLEVIKGSNASTMKELRELIIQRIEDLKQSKYANVSLHSGGELFIRFISMTSLDRADFRAVLLERGAKFLEMIGQSIKRITDLALPFIDHGKRILLHSRSKVVLSLLKKAAKSKINFSCKVTQSMPDKSGERMVKDLKSAGISAELVLDCEIGAAMETIDMVLLGAEAVAQSGGIINKIGTVSVCLCAHALHVPVYVLAESYKFLRKFPLNQADLLKELSPAPVMMQYVAGDRPNAKAPGIDYTQPCYLTLLFTDIGLVPPSAVNDEITNLYL